MNNNPTFFEALNWASLFIQEHHGDENAPSIILMDTFNWSKTELIIHYREKMRVDQWQLFQKQIKKAAQGVPVQYVTNQASFFGRKFYVDNRVLIPRVETEELIELVLAKFPSTKQQALRVLDIGTGSGDIAITLKLERPEWDVTATDLSPAALEVARINANRFETEIDFKQGSMFEPVADQMFDVIISNPPYIASDETADMDASVLEYEPHEALFADDEGLFWYKQIADQFPHYLRSEGQIFCEIGYQQGPVLLDYFSDKSTTVKVEVVKDLSQHDRILWVKRK